MSVADETYHKDSLAKSLILFINEENKQNGLRRRTGKEKQGCR